RIALAEELGAGRGLSRMVVARLGRRVDQLAVLRAGHVAHARLVRRLEQRRRQQRRREQPRGRSGKALVLESDEAHAPPCTAFPRVLFKRGFPGSGSGPSLALHPPLLWIAKPGTGHWQPDADSLSPPL